ncbi:dimethyl sulfoxide reductase anchor subunit family protein [Algirhabdus cladophorae]|uniref:dimethyl sulfoxide reductase anchor subunit family protein n=1 Tax=Algirhabdus cladophorae TaxID=3377108 RepID=UPI003B84640C
MHPAPSVILFTVFSGIGFGMLVFLGLGMPNVSGWTAFIFYAIAYIMAVGGLLSSTFHLGHPERFLKAFTQWRTSWLSREGILSVATLITMALFAASQVFMSNTIAPLGWLGALLSLGTVYGTSMIYAQLKTVPRWNQPTTPALFLILSLAGGSLMTGNVTIALILLLLAGALQAFVWFTGDSRFQDAGHTMETATGLGPIGKVRQFESPHTGTNYLLKEMVHVVGRKHAQKLRILSLLLMVLIPVVLLLLPFTHIFGAFAVLSHIAGVICARWLFFAEAEHVVGLYYGAR